MRFQEACRCTLATKWMEEGTRKREREVETLSGGCSTE